MIGGAPVSEAYANEIQADGFGTNAAEAVDAVSQVLGLSV